MEILQHNNDYYRQLYPGDSFELVGGLVEFSVEEHTLIAAGATTPAELPEPVKEIIDLEQQLLNCKKKWKLQ